VPVFVHKVILTGRPVGVTLFIYETR
jgi:hypothetical protein